MEKILEQIKLLNPPQKEQDDDYKTQYEKMIEFALKKAVNDIYLYTHIPLDEELPSILEQSLVLMASNLITAYGLVDNEETKADAEVSKITEGDTSVEYKDRTTRLQQAMSASSITGDFTGLLNSVRRLS